MFRKCPFVVSFIFFSLIFCVPCLTAQEGSSQIPVLKANALKDFNDGLYHDALVKYDALLERYPKDGIFHYYRGICLLNLNRDFEKAAESLEFAVTRPNIPNNAFYYLGLVYMKSYNFTPAKNNFERFIQLASRQEMRSLEAVADIVARR